jgi:hypothetical protein
MAKARIIELRANRAKMRRIRWRSAAQRCSIANPCHAAPAHAF